MCVQIRIVRNAADDAPYRADQKEDFSQWQHVKYANAREKQSTMATS
jgi:hypothetical protein